MIFFSAHLKVMVVGMDALLRTSNIDELKKTFQVRLAVAKSLMVIAVTGCTYCIVPYASLHMLCLAC